MSYDGETQRNIITPTARRFSLSLIPVHTNQIYCASIGTNIFSSLFILSNDELFITRILLQFQRILDTVSNALFRKLDFIWSATSVAMMEFIVSTIRSITI